MLHNSKLKAFKNELEIMDRNQYVDELKSLLDEYVLAADTVFDSYEDSLEPPDPEPEPEVRPVLPTGFQLSVEGQRVRVSWDALEEGTPQVQVHRKPQFKEAGTGWKNLTSEAIVDYVDMTLSESELNTESEWEYRIRGFGYKRDGSAWASPWSEIKTVTVELDEVEPPRPIGDFVALDHIDSTVEENKLVGIPGLRAERGARASVGTIGDVKRDDWNMGDGDLLKEDLESVVPEGYAQWSSNLHKKLEVRPGTYTWRNIGVRPGPGARQLKWGTREFNASFRSFIACDFTDIPREHGLYVSNYEGTLVEDCTFLRCGSQGVQFAHREEAYQQYGADNLPYESKPTHVVRNSHFVDNAYKGDRPSFNLTYFDPGNSANPGTMVVEDCSFVCDWPEARYDGKKSSGAMVLSHMQGNPDLRDQCMMESVTVRNCLFDFTKGDRSLVSIRSTDQILFEDCAFIARDHAYRWIGIDKVYGADDLGNTKSDVITFRNCETRGGVMLKVFLTPDAQGNQAMKSVDVNCPGEEIKVSGATGEIISRRAL